MIVATFIAAVLPFMPMSLERKESDEKVEVKITQKYLLPVCSDGAPVPEGERQWRLVPGSHSLAFTMRGDPHQRVPGATADAGVAVVEFALEAGHKYEVEVRADAATFASRVWTLGEWKPVVRDRTSDRIVSSEPSWTHSECKH